MSVIYISRVLSNVRSVLSQCNTWLRLLDFLYESYRFYARKAINHAFSRFYTMIKHGFSTNQSTRRVLAILKKLMPKEDKIFVPSSVAPWHRRFWCGNQHQILLQWRHCRSNKLSFVCRYKHKRLNMRSKGNKWA